LEHDNIDDCALHFCWLAQRGFKPVSIELRVTFVFFLECWLFSVDSTTGFPATVVDKQIEVGDIITLSWQTVYLNVLCRVIKCHHRRTGLLSHFQLLIAYLVNVLA